MIDMATAPNLVKARNLHPETRVLREETLHLMEIVPGHFETLGTVQAQFKGHLIKFHIIPNHFSTPYEGILGWDFLIVCSGNFDPEAGYMLWNSIKIPFAIQDSIVASARSVATLYVSNKEVQIGLVPRLHLGEGIYAGDAVAINSNEKAYIRVINTRDTDAKIVIPRV